MPDLHPDESLAIVKIFAQYEYSKGGWAMGTGWLIRPDLMVTAGHIVFNHGSKFGRATVIKAYIGYSGKKSIGTPGVQFRTGSRCVTTAAWLSRKGAKAFDVGFIRLNKPFDGIEPIEFMETPTSGTSLLGVVGYPGDLEHDGERGAHMYEMFVEVREPFV
jgi:V8-like Glu-specific endopeptidase